MISVWVQYQVKCDFEGCGVEVEDVVNHGDHVDTAACWDNLYEEFTTEEGWVWQSDSQEIHCPKHTEKEIDSK